MSILDKFYTLESPVFKTGIVVGYSGQVAVNQPTLIVGGAAVQLAVQNSELLRPTNDIDISVVGVVGKSLKKSWARYVSAEARRNGFPCEGRLTRYGAEVRFDGLDLDFIIHLDSFPREFFQDYEHIFRGEYERSETYNVDGIEVRAKAPVDIIANKIRRMRSLVVHRNATLNAEQTRLIGQLEAGGIDDINPGNLKKRLDGITSKRRRSIEDLGREGCIEILNDINGYVLEKDMYDVLLVIDAARKQGKSIDSKILRDSLAIQRDLSVTTQ